MGGGSTGKNGNSDKETRTQTNAPPAWALPLFRQGADDAMRFYHSGSGGNVYQGQRVADPGDVTRNAISGLQESASAFDHPDLAGLATARTSAAQNLGDMASGQYLRQGNPYYRERLNDEISAMAAQVNSRMSGAGRYGSGANTDVLAKNTAGMLMNGMENDYNRAMQNMLAANSQIDSANQSRLQAAGNYFRNRSAAHEAALRGGQVLDHNAQNKLNAEQQKWTEEDNRDWNRLGYLQNAANGFAGNYGRQSTVTENQRRQGSAPWPLGGDGGGGLGALFNKSDRRAKTGIVRAGGKNGFQLYEFSYIGRPERYRGVMAQDIIKTHPHAVCIDPADGLYCVDYACLGLVMQPLAMAV